MTEKENKSELNSPAAGTPDDESQSLEDTIRKIKPYIDKLWAKKKQFLIFNGVVAVLAVIGLLLFAKPYYISTVSILPEYGNQSSVMSSLSGLASMAGINVGDVSPNQIYEKVLLSEKVISELVYKNYKTEEFKDSINLIEYFEIEAKDESMPAELIERSKFLTLYKGLVKARLFIEIDRGTNILYISVKMPESKLSADVANALAASLNNYVMTERQSNAREQAEYLFTRINEVRDSLQYHENQLKEFREKNRDISNSPQLLLEQNRLNRKVEIAQSVFIELTKQYELIKLEEIKDTPVVNIMEKAEQPIEKAGPRRKLIFFIIIIFSLIISVIYLFFIEKFKKYFSLLRE